MIQADDLSTDSPPRRLDYGVMVFLLLTPVIGIGGTAIYTWIHGFSLWMPLLAIGMYLAVGLSICAGYHRFFSHRSYDASPLLQTFFAVFGAMAAQNSILAWSSAHRTHHQYADRDWDPYNIKRGFWWAHILWIFHHHDAPDVEGNARDLLANPIVQWQERWYKPLLIVAGFGLPALIGAMFGDWIAGLLWGGFLRLVVIHHTTFFVNSLAHYIGDPAYNAELSARDNWAVALLTLGEGYHSFHHRFPADYRNGIRWYHWDPSKWFIATLRFAGLTRSLRSTPSPQVEHARMQAAVVEIEPALAAASGPRAEEVRRRIEAATAHLSAAFAFWRESDQQRSGSPTRLWRDTRRTARAHLREARHLWTTARRNARTILADRRTEGVNS